MSEFIPSKQIINSTEILEEDGSLPSFYESHIISLNYRRGDFLQDIGVFDEPTIEASIEMTYHEPPYILDINFYRCSSIVMSYFNYENVIVKLTFLTKDRGFYQDGITPLPPYIYVEIGTPEYSFCEETGCHSERTVFTSFKCFEIEVAGKREITGASHA